MSAEDNDGIRGVKIKGVEDYRGTSSPSLTTATADHDKSGDASPFANGRNSAEFNRDTSYSIQGLARVSLIYHINLHSHLRVKSHEIVLRNCIPSQPSKKFRKFHEDWRYLVLLSRHVYQLLRPPLEIEC